MAKTRTAPKQKDIFDERESDAPADDLDDMDAERLIRIAAEIEDRSVDYGDAVCRKLGIDPSDLADLIDGFNAADQERVIQRIAAATGVPEPTFQSEPLPSVLARRGVLTRAEAAWLARQFGE